VNPGPDSRASRSIRIFFSNMSDQTDGPKLPKQLVELVLSKLGLANFPSPDLVGLNQLLAAVSASTTR
jgi:hypothetical protein